MASLIVLRSRLDGTEVARLRDDGALHVVTSTVQGMSDAVRYAKGDTVEARVRSVLTHMLYVVADPPTPDA